MTDYSTLTDEQLLAALEEARSRFRQAEVDISAIRVEAAARQKEPWVKMAITRKQWQHMRALQNKGFSVNLPEKEA